MVKYIQTKKIFLYISSLLIIKCTYRQEAYHFFDNFYYKDKIELYEKQQNNKKCTSRDGPDCFFLSKYNNIENSLKNITPEIKIPYYLTLLNLKESLSDSTNVVKSKAKLEVSKPFELNSVTQLTLLLNFESFDVKTKIKDILAPEEIVTNFDMGFIKLTLFGKLLLTYNNQIKTNEKPKNLEEESNTPSGTYGIIESNELIIKFDKPMFLVSLFIKKNKNNKSNLPFIIYAEYKGKQFSIATEKNAQYNKWTKVNTLRALSDLVILPKGFDIDNLSILYSSNYDENHPHISQGKYSKMIEKAIKQGLSSGTVKVVNLADLQNVNVQELNDILNNNINNNNNNNNNHNVNNNNNNHHHNNNP